MNVLIADDESLERRGLKYLIHKYGFDLDILESPNGLSAKKLLDEQPVDILITDLKMPFMDGIELSKHARQLYPDMKIILYSAYSQFEYAKAAIELGVVHYIVKPINCDEFKAVMDKILLTFEKERRQKEMLHQYENIRNMASSNEPVNSDTVTNVKRIVESRYTENISLEEIAKGMYLSVGYLSHLFREKTGQTFTKYLNDYRLNMAVYLLHHSHMKISDICRRAGFQNPSYFGELFRKKYGVTPKEYRNTGCG